MALLGVCAPAQAADKRPDLVADPPVDRVIVQQDAGAGARMLLRFNGFVHNAGPGDLVLKGTDGANKVMGQVAQQVFDDAGGSRLVSQPLAALRYETTDSHKHWHLMRIAEYALVGLTDDVTVAPAQKVGFCLVDSDRVENNGPAEPAYETNCLWEQPNATAVSMGLSAGWRDVYGYELDFQWIDVTAVQPGRYRLRSRVDAENVVTEANDVNPPGFTQTPVVVPGYRAKARSAAVRAGAPTEIGLAADAFDHPGFRATADDDWRRGPVEYKVVDGPDHGTLEVPTGTWFSDPDVTYTPNAGASRADSFRFVARDATAPGFPASPAEAAVTLTADGSKTPVAVSGAPARMIEGTSVQLTAPEPVVWSATGGSVTPSGLFTAAPGAGQAVVRAEGATGEVGKATIAIDPEPVVQGIPAAPIPGPVASPDIVSPPGTITPPERKPQAVRIPTLRVAALRRGPNVATSVRVQRAGRVRVTLLNGKRRARTCTFNAVRGRTYGCRLRVPARAKDLRVHAVLLSPDRPALGRTVAIEPGHRR